MQSANLKSVIVLGAGQGLNETLAIIHRLNFVERRFEVVGALDDDDSKWGTQVDDCRVLGPISMWASLASDLFFVHAIGNLENRELRHQIFKTSAIPKNRFVNVIDPTATILVPDSSLGIGVIIHPGVVVYPKSEIGDFVVLSSNTVIGFENRIGCFSLVAGSASTTAGVAVGPLAFIGAGAIIAPKLKIGVLGFVALGSVVHREVASGEYVAGNPARPFSKIEVSEHLIDLAC
jgi:sugar O-acyltransferase (sialic acid O-acetyltransferase NeuD family)